MPGRRGLLQFAWKEKLLFVHVRVGAALMVAGLLFTVLRRGGQNYYYDRRAMIPALPMLVLLCEQEIYPHK